MFKLNRNTLIKTFLLLAVFLVVVFGLEPLTRWLISIPDRGVEASRSLNISSKPPITESRTDSDVQSSVPDVHPREQKRYQEPFWG